MLTLPPTVWSSNGLENEGLCEYQTLKVGIGRAVGNRQLVGDSCQFHVLHGGFQIGPGVQRDVPEFLERLQLFGEIKRPGNIELLDRRAVVQQHQEWNLGRPQIHQRGFEVGFELNALQLQATQIHLSDIAGRVARSIHAQLPIPIFQVVSGVLKYRFRLQSLNECAAKIEDQVALLIQISRFRDSRGLLRLISPQFPLVLPFVQVADAGRFNYTAEGAPDSSVLADLKPISGYAEVRVRAQISRYLHRPRFVDVEPVCFQCRIRGFESLLLSAPTLTVSDPTGAPPGFPQLESTGRAVALIGKPACFGAVLCSNVVEVFICAENRHGYRITDFEFSPSLATFATNLLSKTEAPDLSFRRERLSARV